MPEKVWIIGLVGGAYILHFIVESMAAAGLVAWGNRIRRFFRRVFLFLYVHLRDWVRGGRQHVTRVEVF